MSKKYTDARINGLSFEDKLRLFGSVLTSAREDILLAGRLLVAMRKEKADALDQIVKRYNLPEKKLRALEEIGLGHLDPIWLTDTSPVARLVLQRQLCTEDQKKLVTGHYIPVRVPDGNGGRKTVTRQMSEMNPQIADQVIGAGHLRTDDEQDAYIDEREAVTQRRQVRYTTGTGTVIINKSSTFSCRDLVVLALKCSPSQADLRWMIEQLQAALKKM
jgi:hypothetical protein